MDPVTAGDGRQDEGDWGPVREESVSEFWWTMAFYVFLTVNFFTFYNLPFISLIRWILVNSRKVGIEKLPLVLYSIWMIFSLIVHSIVIILFPMDSCPGLPSLQCYKVMVVIIFNIIKIIMSLMMLMLARQLPESEISQMKYSLKKNENLDMSLGDNLLDSSDLQSDKDMQNFFLEIDKKQAIDDDDQFCHVLRFLYKEDVDAQASGDHYSKESLHRLQRSSNFQNVSISNKFIQDLSNLDNIKIISKETLKTEHELMALAKRLDSLLKNKAHQVLFLDPTRTDLDLVALERLINSLMNDLKSSAFLDHTNDICCQLVSEFLGMNWRSPVSRVWLEDFSLCTEFPQTFTLTADQAAILFRNFLVKTVSMTRKKGFFRLCVTDRKSKRELALVKNIGQIEKFVQKVFRFLELPFECSQASFPKELGYLLNVALNEIQDERALCSFLRTEDLVFQPISVLIPKVSCSVESCLSPSLEEPAYKLMLEYDFYFTSLVEVVRSKRHFRLISRNLEQKFGPRIGLDLEEFGDKAAVSRWLQGLLKDALVWNCVEFRVFISYFEQS